MPEVNNGCELQHVQIVRGVGICRSGRFVVLNKPLLPSSKAAAACIKVGKVLATISGVFGQPSMSLYPDSRSHVADL